MCCVCEWSMPMKMTSSWTFNRFGKNKPQKNIFCNILFIYLYSLAGLVGQSIEQIVIGNQEKKNISKTNQIPQYVREMDFPSAINQRTQRNNCGQMFINQYLKWTNERYTISFSRIPEYCSQRVPFPSHHRLQIGIHYSRITNPKQFESFWE